MAVWPSRGGFTAKYAGNPPRDRLRSSLHGSTGWSLDGSLRSSGSGTTQSTIASPAVGFIGSIAGCTPSVTRRRGGVRCGWRRCLPPGRTPCSATARPLRSGVFRATARTRVEVICARRLDIGGIESQRDELPPDEVTVHDGVPVTNAARTLFDLAAVVTGQPL